MMSEPVNAESIPAALRSRSQWVMWRYESRGTGKPTKVPRTIDGALASTTGPGTWCSFAQAIAASPRFDGVGFVFTATDPWCGIDIDGCFAEDGTLLAWAVDLVSVAQTCEAYIERTPSGRGLHVIGVGVLPGRGRKVTGLGADGRGAVEVYDRDRYFTVTGEQTDLGDVGRDMGPLLAHIWRQYGLRDDADVVVDPGVEVTDARADELTRVLLAASRADFLGLWNGVYDAAQHGADRSRARMSLLTQIALKLSTEARIATPAEVRAVALRSPFIRQEMQRHKWPRLAGEECARAVAWAAEKLGRTATMDPVTVDEDGVITAPTQRQAYVVDRPSELMTRSDPRWLIRGLLPDRGLAVIYGESGCGKSFAVLDLLASLPRGERWHGRRTRRGVVVYVGLEGTTKRRLWAYMKHHGLTDIDLDDFLVVDGQSVNLLTSDVDADALVQAIRAKTDRPVLAVVFDTLNRVMPGGNENASEDMGVVVARAQRVERALRCLVGFVHHSGKNASSGARGHSSLKAACDLELEVTNSAGVRTITATKVKDGEAGQQFHFRLEQVDLGPSTDPEADEDERVTSLVVVPVEASPAETSRTDPLHLTKSEQDAWAAFCESAAQSGLTHGMRADYGINDLEAATHLVQWRGAFDTRRPLTAPLGAERSREMAARRKAWRDGHRGLVAKGWVRVNEGLGIAVSGAQRDRD
jgi:hypothetical protein